MIAQRDLSDLLLRRLWGELARKPGDRAIIARIAQETARRTDLKMNYGPVEASVEIGPDGVLRALPQAADLGQ